MSLLFLVSLLVLVSRLLIMPLLLFLVRIPIIAGILLLVLLVLLKSFLILVASLLWFNPHQNDQGRKGPCCFQRLIALKCLKCQKI
jgi:hypothetical protein